MTMTSNTARATLWRGPRYLCQLLLRRKPQAKYRVGSAVGPLPKLLRRFGESHVGCDCAVYNHLQENSPESGNVNTESGTTEAAYTIPSAKPGPKADGRRPALPCLP